MPAYKDKDPDIICPFYLTQTRQSVTCEGVIPDTEIMTRFANETCKRRYQKSLCMSFCYTNCRLAEMLKKKYGGE